MPAHVSSSLQTIRDGFISSGLPADLTDALLDSYVESKRRYFLSDLRPNEVEGGRFAEAAFRVLELKVFGKNTPIGKQLPTVDSLVTKLGSTGGHDPGLTIHIPRALHSVYTIRNKRDVAHLGPDISPNLQDATLVVAVMDWVMAELVRIYHHVDNTEAQQIIDDLVTREVPAIQVFDGYPKLLKSVSLPEHILILLYWRGEAGATRSEIATWTAKSTRRQPTTTERSNLTTALNRLDSKGEIHIDGDRASITALGQRRVETKRLVEPV